MDYNEFKEAMGNCENKIEVHEDDFKVMVDFIIINDMVTLRNIEYIRLVDTTLWFNKNSISLDDIDDIYFGNVRSYL